MKHLILIVLSFVSFESIGQIVIAEPEMIYLYKGYDNKLEATSQNGVKKIDLMSPDFIFNKEENGSYTAIATSDPGPAKIYMVDHKKHEVIDTFDVEIRQLPDPLLFLGGAEEGDISNQAETRLFAKYGSEVPLNISFSILEGEVVLESGERFAFSGNTFSADCHNNLLKLKNGSFIQVIAEVKGPDGIIRKIQGRWSLYTL